MRLIASTIAASLFLVGCSRSKSTITLDNQSGFTLSNILISGCCEARHTNELLPRTQWVAVTPHWQDAPIQLSFDSQGQHYTTNSGFYIEGGTSYQIRFVVGSNLAAISEVKNQYQPK